jgi:hypothetical protein
MHLRKLD